MRKSIKYFVTLLLIMVLSDFSIGYAQKTDIMKAIEIPLLAGLDSLKGESLVNELKGKGSHGVIGTINWDSFPNPPKVDFYIARSESKLFLSFFVSEKGIRGVETQDHEKVWQDSCVEFFVKVPSFSGYYNFETNCIGTMLAAKRVSRSEFERLPSEAMERIVRYTSFERGVPIEKKVGEFNWHLVIGIPFDILSLDGKNLPDYITGNFYKCGDETPYPHYLSWNPIETDTPNFHRPEFFGKLIFNLQDGMLKKDISLPSPNRKGGMPLMEALDKRCSGREFSPRELDLQTLSDLLWATWGYNRETKRTAPSSHNRQEIDVYVALASGVYIYDALNNVLRWHSDEDLRSETGMQEFVGTAPLNLIFVSDTSKIKGKDERGVIEATFANTGYISQNCYLYCASVGLSTVARAMVDRAILSKRLSLSETQIITLTQSVGWSK